MNWEAVSRLLIELVSGPFSGETARSPRESPAEKLGQPPPPTSTGLFVVRQPSSQVVAASHPMVRVETILRLKHGRNTAAPDRDGEAPR